MLGCLGSSTPHDLGWVLREDPGTPLAACSHLLLGWGQQVGPTRHQPGQRAELALLWGDGNHTDTPQWKITSSHGLFLGMRTEKAWETRGQRAATKYLGLWRGGFLGSFQRGGRWVRHTWAVLRLGQGELKASPGQCRLWPFRALESNGSFLPALGVSRIISKQTWRAWTRPSHGPLRSKLPTNVCLVECQVWKQNDLIGRGWALRRGKRTGT